MNTKKKILQKVTKGTKKARPQRPKTEHKPEWTITDLIAGIAAAPMNPPTADNATVLFACQKFHRRRAMELRNDLVEMAPYFKRFPSERLKIQRVASQHQQFMECITPFLFIARMLEALQPWSKPSGIRNQMRKGEAL